MLSHMQLILVKFAWFSFLKDVASKIEIFLLQDRNIFIAKEAGPQFIIYFQTVLGRLERSQEDNCYAESCVSSRKCPVKID